MEKTWRWFGPNDPITLDMLRQIGVEGIVTALHDVPNGDVWEIENISRRKAYIESHGLRWSVVESLPVCEAVKYGGAERDRLIENYKNSLANLGRCGIKTVCYNFMPVIDWIRTDLQHPWADGTTSLYFDRTRFAYFDLHILERPGAEKDYPDPLLAKVEEMGKVISEKEKNDLIETIIVKTQGFVNGNIKEALYLSSVEIHGKYAVGARSGNEVCNELCGDGIAAFCLTVLAGVAEIRDNSGYSACGCSAHRVYHDEHLHEVIVNGLAGRLNDENIGAANGLVDGYRALAVSEVRTGAVAEVLEKLVADLICELGIGVAGEYLDLFAVGNHFKSSSLYLFGVSPIVFIY